MDFKNRMKGKITQSLFETLLEDVDYRIVPLGIEEVIREIKGLEVGQYTTLGLSTTFRKIPDFFVASPEFEKTWMIEVKFRRKWTDAVRDALGTEIRDQVIQWGPLYLVIFVGEAARIAQTPASYLGVAKLIYKNNDIFLTYQARDGEFGDGPLIDKFIPWAQVVWNNFSRFQDVFTGVSNRWKDSTLINAISMLKGLNDLE